MQLQFLKLNSAQAKKFQALKTTEDLAMHGPLESGQAVPVHCHERAALYVVNGAATFTDGKKITKTLGQGQPYDAVVVPSQQSHGWKSLLANTMIEHTFSLDINRVLAVA